MIACGSFHVEKKPRRYTAGLEEGESHQLKNRAGVCLRGSDLSGLQHRDSSSEFEHHRARGDIRLCSMEALIGRDRAVIFSCASKT